MKNPQAAHINSIFLGQFKYYAAYVKDCSGDFCTGKNPTVGVAVVLVENNNLPQPMAFPTDLLVCEKLQHCLESNLLSSWRESRAAKDFDA